MNQPRQLTSRQGGQRRSGSGSGLMGVRAARMRPAALARPVAARAASAPSSRRAWSGGS